MGEEGFEFMEEPVEQVTFEFEEARELNSIDVMVKGIQKGLSMGFERGKEQGIAIGFKDGVKKGIEMGWAARERELVLALLQLGVHDTLIMEATSLDAAAIRGLLGEG